MLHSKRSHEGYLLIDNTNSPGVSAEFVRSSGKSAPVVGEGRKFEAPVLTCSHCQAGIIVRPDRTRPRAYCPKCDHYICDTCDAVRVKAGGACSSFSKLLDMVASVAAVNSSKIIDTIRHLRASILR